MVEICDGCHYSFDLSELVERRVPMEDPELAVEFPSRLELLCPACNRGEMSDASS